MAQGIFYEPYLDQIGDKIRELGRHGKESLRRTTTSEVDVAHAKGAIATRKIVVDEHKRVSSRPSYSRLAASSTHG